MFKHDIPQFRNNLCQSLQSFSAMIDFMGIGNCYHHLNHLHGRDFRIKKSPTSVSYSKTTNGALICKEIGLLIALKATRSLSDWRSTFGADIEDMQIYNAYETHLHYESKDLFWSRQCSNLQMKLRPKQILSFILPFPSNGLCDMILEQ